jgi:ribosomal protein S18 acetylase RimI-like enzyme
MAAALSDPASPQTVDLRTVDVESLAAILAEQTEAWKKELDWDFTPSANLVRRFVQMHVLTGYVLVFPGRPTEPIGYSYYVCEEGKGLIGDLYILKRYRTWQLENLLFQASLDALWQAHRVLRIESQLLMLADAGNRRVPYPERFEAFPRLFLEAPAGVRLPARKLSFSISVVPWTEAWQEATGRLIAGAYQNHIDSRINDQYRSANGARRFLTNIVQYPGCGTFFAPGSFAAMAGGALCGVSLASLVSQDIGHITQVCVATSYQGSGLGYELVRRSMEALAAHGCRAVSLTVTAANESALRLYRKMGFLEKRAFAAYVWEPKG